MKPMILVIALCASMCAQMPIAPANANIFNNLQNTSGPGSWVSVSLAGEVGGDGTNNNQGSVTAGNSSPAMSDGNTSMQISSVGYDVNTLAYRHLGCGSVGYAAVSRSSLSANDSSGDLTINVPTLGAEPTSISMTAYGSGNTYEVVDIQVYLNGSLEYDSHGWTGFYTQTGLSPGTNYTFAIKAWNSHGENALITYSVTTPMSTQAGVNCATITNMVTDFYYYPQGTTYQQIEMDPDLTDSGSYAYKASYACRVLGTSPTHAWYLWDTSNTSWVPAPGGPYACNMWSQTDNWHHIQAWTTYNQSSRRYTYESLVVDNVTVFSNLGSWYSPKYESGWGPDFWVENQIDNSTSSGTNTSNISGYSLTVW
jgi:hypothetical protein